MVVENHPERLAAIGVQSAKIFSTTRTHKTLRPEARKTAIHFPSLRPGITIFYLFSGGISSLSLCRSKPQTIATDKTLNTTPHRHSTQQHPLQCRANLST